MTSKTQLPARPPWLADFRSSVPFVASEAALACQLLYRRKFIRFGSPAKPSKMIAPNVAGAMTAAIRPVRFSQPRSLFRFGFEKDRNYQISRSNSS